MIKAENIAAKEFRKSLYGYDCEQVDRYLDEIIAQLRQMEQERAEMAATIEYLAGELEGDLHQLPHADSVVGPVSPHKLLSDTGRRRLTDQPGKSTGELPKVSEPADPTAKSKKTTGELPKIPKTAEPEKPDKAQRPSETPQPESVSEPAVPQQSASSDPSDKPQTEQHEA